MIETSWESKLEQIARVTDTDIPEEDRITLVCGYDPWEREWEVLYGVKPKQGRILGIPSCFSLKADYLAALEELRNEE